MTTIPASAVYTGPWVDYSYGSVLGSTITLTASSANILIAFLASLVSLASIQLWQLIAFVFYLVRTDQGPNDGLYHQQQVLLRNASAPGNVLGQFCKIAWFWRGAARRSLLRNVIPVTLALMCSIGFLVAGIFTSKIVTSSNFNVLIRKDLSVCGMANPVVAGTSDDTAWVQYWTQTLKSSLQYERLCYNITAGADPVCAVYAKDALPVQQPIHTDCPFESSMCTHPAISIDTGLMDSNDDYGINAEPEDRIQCRKKTTCAPINTVDYTRAINASEIPNVIVSTYGREPLPGEQRIQWYYGAGAGNSDVSPNFDLGNSTTGISNYAANSTLQFIVNSRSHYIGGQSDFTPIPPLLRSDADINLVFVMSNAIDFNAPIDDPIFSAHRPFVATRTGGNLTYYRADYPAGVVGCITQHQYCNPSSGKCTELAGSNNLDDAAMQGLELNPVQTKTMKLVSFYQLDVSAAGQMQPPPLVAVETQDEGDQYQLPSNQWEIEVQNWINLALAASQKFISAYAVGASVTNPNIKADTLVEAPTDDEGMHLCGTQKMRAPNGFSNINVFGLSFVIAICGLLILLNQALMPMLKFINRYTARDIAGLSYWTQDGVLQLQKNSYEAVDLSEWRGLNTEFPVVAAKHRRFQRLSRSSTLKPEGSVETSPVLECEKKSEDSSESQACV